MHEFILQPVLQVENLTDILRGSNPYSVGSNRSWVQHWMEWVLPWTLIKTKPGIATVSIDILSGPLVHGGVWLIKAMAARPGLNWKVLATLLAVAVQLGVPPGYIQSLIETDDQTKQREFAERVQNEIEARVGGKLVLEFRQGQFVDP